MSRSRLFEALEDRALALGTTVQMNAPEIAELQSAAGLDFIMIDMEHGALGIEGATGLIRAVRAGGAATPIVRLPGCSAIETARILDAGAQGIIVPNVETAEQLRGIVDAAYYAPKGKRGACPCVRANDHGVRPWQDYADWSNANMFICAIIETVEGVRNFDEIISVPGLNAICIGTFDLGMSMGHGSNYDHPEVTATFNRLSTATRERGLELLGGVLDFNQLDAELESLTAAGVRLVLYPGDRFLLSALYRSAGQSLAKVVARSNH